MLRSFRASSPSHSWVKSCCGQTPQCSSRRTAEQPLSRSSAVRSRSGPFSARETARRAACVSPCGQNVRRAPRPCRRRTAAAISGRSDRPSAAAARRPPGAAWRVPAAGAPCRRRRAPAGRPAPCQPERGRKLRRQVPFCQIAPSPQHWDSSPPVPGSNPSKKVCLSEFPHCIFPKT